MGQPHGIGIVGLGVISGAYLDTLVGHPSIRIAAVADLDAARSASVAASLPDAAARTVEELMADPDVQTVLNLTTPAAHAGIAFAAIARGKAVYGEKPLAATLADAAAVMRAAEKAGVGVGCAPDTVLGTGIQTARSVVDDGLIGRPVSASATWVSPGHEAWHPNPDFYYLDGGGPLLDMGPYYLTSLLHLLGPVRSVIGAGSRARTSRTIASGPRAGVEIAVEVDTHVTGVLEHVSGALSTVTFSFDAAGTRASSIEVHGQNGSLVVPDPNRFDGDVLLRRTGSDDWDLVAPRGGYIDGARGVGLLDFVSDAPDAARASGAVALHVLEVMTGLLDSARSGTRIEMQTRADRPAPVPLIPAARWQRR